MISVSKSVKYMFLSALCFALMGACAKESGLRGIPVLEMIMARSLISSIISYLDIRRKKISPWGYNKLLLTVRGLVGTLSLFCVFYAVTVLPLAEATLLQYLYPIFTATLAFFFLKEGVQRSTIVCIIFSMIGLVIIVQPTFLFGALIRNSEPLPLIGVGAALLGAFGSGTAYVVVRRLNTTEDASVIIFYFPIIALPVSCLFLGKDFVLPAGSTWLLLLLLGIFTQLAQYGLTMAMQTEKAGKATAYSYVQIIFSAILGWLLFNEIPTISTLTGALFIISGALINVLHKSKPQWCISRRASESIRQG